MPVRPLRALALGALLAASPAVLAQATDTLQADEGRDPVAEALRTDVDRGIRVRPLFSPAALYSPSRGIGIGGGIEIEGLGSHDATLGLEARLTQRFQSAQASFYTGDPYLRAVYGMGAAAVTTTDRLAFYGTGPRSRREGRLYLDQVSTEAEARVGWYPYRRTGLLVQPNVRFRFDRLRDYEAGRDSSVFETPDTAPLDAVLNQDRYGLAVGVEAAGDTRDRRASPHRGYLLQAGVSRFQALDGSGLGFNRVEASGYYFMPAWVRLPFLPERGTVFVRSSFVLTRQDRGDELPYYYLPVMDQELLAGFPQRRFVGRDGFSVGIGARGTVLAVLGAVLVEGVGMVMLGGAYDNIFQDFSPRVTFDPEPVGEDQRVPLRPSIALGMNIVTIDRDTPVVGGMIGFGPEGFVLSTLRIVFDIRDYRPQIR